MTRLRAALAIFRAVPLLLLAFTLSGCWGTPTEGPRLDARGNSGTINANFVSGSGNSQGTAPCASRAAQKIGDNRPAEGDNCPTTTITNPPAEPAA